MARPLGRTLRRGERASSFSASPSANPAGVRKRMPTPPVKKLRCRRAFCACACSSSRRRAGSQVAHDARAGPTSCRRLRRRRRATIVNGAAWRRHRRPARQAGDRGGQPHRREALRYGGGHKPFAAAGSTRAMTAPARSRYALSRGPLPALAAALGTLMNWGQPGPGQWITVYAHGGHAYVVVAGCASTPRCTTGTLRAPDRSPLEPHAPHLIRLRGAPPARLLGPAAPTGRASAARSHPRGRPGRRWSRARPKFGGLVSAGGRGGVPGRSAEPFRPRSHGSTPHVSVRGLRGGAEIQAESAPRASLAPCVPLTRAGRRPHWPSGTRTRASLRPAGLSPLASNTTRRPMR